MIGKKLLPTVIFVLLLPAIALADGDNSNYFTLRGGVGVLSDIDRTAGSRTSNIEYETAFSGGIAAGKEVLPGLRLEGEFNYMRADVDEVTGHFNQDTDESGSEQFFAFMFNAFYDFHNATNFTPFAGGGIGPVYARHKITFDPILGDTIPAVNSDDTTWVLGYQLMAGAAWEFKPGIYLDVMYRFFGTGSRDHVQDNVAVNEVDLGSTQNHMFVAGIRWEF